MRNISLKLYMNFGLVVQEEMLFKTFLIKSSDSLLEPFVKLL